LREGELSFMNMKQLMSLRRSIRATVVSSLFLTTSFTSVSCNQSGQPSGEGEKRETPSLSSGAPSGAPLANPTALDPNLFVNLVKRAVPSVVNISTASLVKSPYAQGAPDDLFRR